MNDFELIGQTLYRLNSKVKKEPIWRYILKFTVTIA
jgi:hypothetical protein